MEKGRTYCNWDDGFPTEDGRYLIKAKGFCGDQYISLAYFRNKPCDTDYWFDYDEECGDIATYCGDIPENEFPCFF